MSHQNRRSARASLLSLILGIVAVSVLICGVYKVVEAGVLNTQKQLTPTTGSVIWKTIPDPKNPSRALPSVVGGTLMTFKVNGSIGAKATWSFTNLLEGRYKVSMLFPSNNETVNSVTVWRKTTGEIGFSKAAAFDQSSNSKDYVKKEVVIVQGNSTSGGVRVPRKLGPGGTANSGSLTIELRIGNGAVAGRLMMADTVKIERLGPI